MIILYNYFQMIMNTQGQLRPRESKRKIFLDDSHKPRPQQPLPLPKKTSLECHSPHNDEQSRRQIQQLQQSVKQLKNLLLEQRQKYDQLFEEYEQLIEKNNLIEKEYINLKYEHNKEMKNVKKSCKEKVEEEIRKCIEEFNSRLSGQAMMEGVRQKIERFIASLERVSESFLMKSRKYHNHEMQLKTSDLLQKLNRKQDSVITQKQSRIDFYEMQQKIESSPTKQPHIQLPQTVPQSKQLLFEDEYYGDLQDYEHLEQKLALRRNFELMKNVNRSSNEFRRKKIFNKPVAFQ